MKNIRGQAMGARRFTIIHFRWAFVVCGLLFCHTCSQAQSKTYRLTSPDGAVSVRVEAGPKFTWLAYKGDQLVIARSAISLQLGDGIVIGDSAKIVSDKAEKIDRQFNAINYVRAVVRDDCSQLTLNFDNDFGVIFRAYNDAVAYRFFTKKTGELIIKNEEANFNFTDDNMAFIPYLWDYRDGKIFNASFESPYTESKLSEATTQFPQNCRGGGLVEATGFWTLAVFLAGSFAST